MSSPLDDAFRKLDEKARRDAIAAKIQEEDQRKQNELFISLATDFLSRMREAGNPGTKTIKLSLFERIKGWRLIIVNSENPTKIFLTVKGTVQLNDYISSRPFVEVSKFDIFGHGNWQDALAQSMALELRSHGLG